MTLADAIEIQDSFQLAGIDIEDIADAAERSQLEQAQEMIESATSAEIHAAKRELKARGER